MRKHLPHPLHEQTVDTPSKLQNQNVFEKTFLKGQFLVFRTPSSNDPDLLIT